MLNKIVQGDALEKELAYCAGIIDADGTIGIKRSTYAMRVRKDANAPMFSERICVKQVQPQAVDLLKRLFGGYRGIDYPSVENGKYLHMWQATDKKAANCLRLILPYLRIKQAQAVNCLELRDAKERSKKAKVPYGRGHMGASRRPQELTDEMERLCLRAKKLNSSGRG